jgi:hypothetical protein
VVERGARAILIRPAPVPGFRGSRSFALPEFDPFWKRVVETGRAGRDALLRQRLRPLHQRLGGPSEMLPFKPNAFRMVAEWRPIQDAVASWVCHGALFRFPELKVAVIENGSKPGWSRCSTNWPTSTRRCRRPSWATRSRRSRTSIHISPFWEEDMAALSEDDRRRPGAVRLGLPAPRGPGRPDHYVDALEHLSDEDQAKIMGGNLARLIGRMTWETIPRDGAERGRPLRRRRSGRRRSAAAHLRRAGRPGPGGGGRLRRIRPGSSKGDRVAIWAPNSAEWIIAAFGLLTAGGVLVPVNTRFKADEAATSSPQRRQGRPGPEGFPRPGLRRSRRAACR